MLPAQCQARLRCATATTAASSSGSVAHEVSSAALVVWSLQAARETKAQCTRACDEWL